MRNIKLTIEYDGTAYCGWQRQENAVSIQETLEKAVRAMTGEPSDVIGASRTDAGVHAIGQAAHFITETNIPCDGFLRGLNSMLPEDIRIVGAMEAAEGFHSRKSAKSKLYRYAIHSSPAESALLARRAWHIPNPLDSKAMKKAAEAFVGKHDFAAFQAAGAGVKHAVRTLYEVKINYIKGREGDNNLVPVSLDGIAIDFKGDGFVRHMVRNMVGTIVEVGLGKLSAEDIPFIIDGRKRSAAGICAPAHGLYLIKVMY
jgi:tRNA pseudouridine38-40 synthase